MSALHAIPYGEIWLKEDVVKRHDEIKATGFTWDVVESLPIHEDIKRGIGDLPLLFANYRQSLANLSADGIKTVCYDFRLRKWQHLKSICWGDIKNGKITIPTQLSMEFNRPEHNIVDHFTYAFVGDGCLMEGISHEACSLAGTLGLSKLIVIYDDNNISIDGRVDDWFSDNTAMRFRSYGWQVIDKVDGHDYAAIDQAISQAKEQAVTDTGQPTIICCTTIIGKGAPNKQDSEHVHGAPLGAEELAATRKELDWSHPLFVMPDDISSAWNAMEAGKEREAAWQQQLAHYSQQHPELAAELIRRSAGILPSHFAETANTLLEQTAKQSQEQLSVATRKASQQALDRLAPHLPELFGGSADLTGSNLTNFKDSIALKPRHQGNHLSYGVREFAMTAMMNGIALHGGHIPYGGTFLTFSDYSRNAIRLSALMKKRVIHVFTHDSIGLGEDGPTHQAVEHIPSLRIIPNLDLWRPCDAMETIVAWIEAIARDDAPSALILSRQAMPNIHTDTNLVDSIKRGGYIVSDCDEPQASIIATGSEVGVALDAQRQLAQSDIHVRVISMPCSQRFDRQSADYQQQVLPKSLPILVIEAAHPDFWYKYLAQSQHKGRVLGIDSFGHSAPAAEIYQHFGLTAEALCDQVKDCLK